MASGKRFFVEVRLANRLAGVRISINFSVRDHQQVHHSRPEGNRHRRIRLDRLGGQQPLQDSRTSHLQFEKPVNKDLTLTLTLARRLSSPATTASSGTSTHCPSGTSMAAPPAKPPAATRMSTSGPAPSTRTPSGGATTFCMFTAGSGFSSNGSRDCANTARQRPDRMLEPRRHSQQVQLPP